VLGREALPALPRLVMTFASPCTFVSLSSIREPE